MKILGTVYGHPNARDTNVVQWNLVENKLQRDGIPDIFRCGVIVMHDQEEFIADVKVSFSTCSALRQLIMNGMPWTKDHPIFFKRGEVTERVDALHEYAGRDLSTLTDEEYLRLAPMPTEFEVHKFLISVPMLIYTTRDRLCVERDSTRRTRWTSWPNVCVVAVLYDLLRSFDNLQSTDLLCYVLPRNQSSTNRFSPTLDDNLSGIDSIIGKSHIPGG